MTYRPTTLRLASRHCPRAIDYYEEDTPHDRAIFTAGIAAHGVLQAIMISADAIGRGLEPAEIQAVADSTADRMIREGRTFEGRSEPPLPADDVYRGRDLAVAYLVDHPIGPGSVAEMGLAVDERWRPVPYDAPERRLRLIVDAIAIEEEGDEESSARVLTVTDYKSAWSTGEHSLDTLQIRAQAVVAWIHHGDVTRGGEGVDCIRSAVVNLRTGAIYRRELWLAEDGVDTLRQWQRDIQSVMDAYDAMPRGGEPMGAGGMRRPIPGAGCGSCPYLHACVAGRSFIQQAEEHATPEARAAAYVAMLDRLERMKVLIRADTEERPVELGDGRVVGTVAKPTRVPTESAPLELWREWAGRGGEPEGFVGALGIGVSQMESAAKVLYPERSQAKERREWLAPLITTRTDRRFGIHAADSGE